MAFIDLKQWVDILETEGELKRINTKVDWNGEIAGIVSRAYSRRGPALLFENIKDYEGHFTKFDGGGQLHFRPAQSLPALPLTTCPRS